jgi:hypothetical protein
MPNRKKRVVLFLLHADEQLKLDRSFALADRYFFDGFSLHQKRIRAHHPGVEPCEITTSEELQSMDTDMWLQTLGG